LLHESTRTRKLSDAAFAAGFNGLSYFHRAFRSGFEMTLPMRG
jgi:AraC-like DNA-binding protein